MSYLPERNALDVQEQKLKRYLLDPEHQEGGTKARFFLNRGFTVDEWEHFARAIRRHGQTQPVTHELPTRHGCKYVVECQMESPDGANPASVPSGPRKARTRPVW